MAPKNIAMILFFITSLKSNHLNVSSWKDIVDISAGTLHTIGLKKDGTVVSVGDVLVGNVNNTKLNTGNITDVKIPVTIKNELKAIELSNLGMLSGSNSGFELDKQLTRNQGSVIITKLLGKEAEALSQNYTHPFDDVPKWASPYVGFLYKNNISSGISPKKFGSDKYLTAQEYITLILKALGYTDVSLNESLSKAEAIGILSTDDVQRLSSNTQFSRDDMVLITYNTLKFLNP